MRFFLFVVGLLLLVGAVLVLLSGESSTEQSVQNLESTSTQGAGSSFAPVNASTALRQRLDPDDSNNSGRQDQNVLELHFVDQAGAPVESVAIHAFEPALEVFKPLGYSDEYGRFADSANAIGDRVITAYKAGFARWHRTLTPGTAGVILITLESGRAFEGQLARPDGRAIPEGTRVLLLDEFDAPEIKLDSDQAHLSSGYYSGTTDQDGRFYIDALEMGRTYRVAVVSPYLVIPDNEQSASIAPTVTEGIVRVLPSLGHVLRLTCDDVEYFEKCWSEPNLPVRRSSDLSGRIYSTLGPQMSSELWVAGCNVAIGERCVAYVLGSQNPNGPSRSTIEVDVVIPGFEQPTLQIDLGEYSDNGFPMTVVKLTPLGSSAGALRMNFRAHSMSAVGMPVIGALTLMPRYGAPIKYHCDVSDHSQGNVLNVPSGEYTWSFKLRWVGLPQSLNNGEFILVQEDSETIIDIELGGVGFVKFISSSVSESNPDLIVYLADGPVFTGGSSTWATSVRVGGGEKIYGPLSPGQYYGRVVWPTSAGDILYEVTVRPSEVSPLVLVID